MEQSIIVNGAVENNLKNVSIRIPKNKLVVFTGVSGSGKSSLVFDTIAVESTRQLAEALPPYVRNRMPHYEAPKARLIDNLSTAIIIDQRPFSGDIRSTVATMADIAPLMRLLFSRCAKPRIGYSPSYSYTDPRGMCPECAGLGYKIRFDPDKLLDKSKSLNEGAILFTGHKVGTYQWELYARCPYLDPDKKLEDYSEQEWFDFLHGNGVNIPITNQTGSVLGDYQLKYEGLLDRITRLYLNRDSSKLTKASKKAIDTFTTRCACPSCSGARLNAAALGSRILGKNISELGDIEISQLIPLLSQITDPVGIPTAQKIIGVLRGIEDMGLGYLTLNRQSNSLSGGEAQRLRIVRHLGSSLTGLLFIFDEPTVGLHPKDVERLSRLLLRLRDRGNSVLVVEHNRQIMQIADHIVELGPGAGANGGEIVFEGIPEALLSANTKTGASLRKKLCLSPSQTQLDQFFEIRNASLHNLKNISVRFPKGALTVVTGLSGAGKTSLACGELLRQYPQAECIDQGPIGTTSKSNPATYTGVMDEIRAVFAKENNIDAGMFSYNSTGACPACEGRGEIKTEMAFMDPVSIPCEICHGKRYSDQALQYRYHGKSILDVLDMTIDEAINFFDSPKITSKLQILSHIGMGYMTLGQPTNTLSGGECQRVKLAAYLKNKKGILVLDEPTGGLHEADVELLLSFLDELIHKGNTIVIVEHNPAVILHADWVIDLGPEGGRDGGKVLFEGTPRELLDCPNSATAKYLRTLL